jgi:hypothetical protein
VDREFRLAVERPNQRTRLRHDQLYPRSNGYCMDLHLKLGDGQALSLSTRANR